MQIGNSTAKVEKTKYEHMWEVPDYARTSPGANIADAFMKISGCKPGETLIDCGTGSGKAALKLANEYGLRVNTLDITDTSMIPKAQEQFGDTHTKASLWSDWPTQLFDRGLLTPRFNYAYCCDVMEHIPVQWTMLSLANLFRSANHVFIQVDVEPEGWGDLIGEVLHLTVMPFVWWRDHIAEFGEILDCRDMIATPRRCLFYVRSNW